MSTCPPAECLRRLLADELEAADRLELEEHVEACRACQECLERWTAAALIPVAEHPQTPAASDPAPGTDLASLDQLQIATHERSPTWSTLEPTRATAVPAASSSWPEIPGFDILGVLGRGGMGVVYKARHRRLKRVVALKMILAGVQVDPERRTRFRIEAEAVARLQHPNVVQIFEVGEWAAGDGGLPVPYCALEYVDGGTLEKALAGRPQPAARAAELVEALARAVHAAHEGGILHRDLKPANVLLTAAGVPKLTDFGLAKVLSAGSVDVPPGQQTQSGTVLGTPSYMAPEQAAGHVGALGPATDVYSLGTILYELVTGRPPFRGESALETLRQVGSEEPVPPRRLQPRLPVDLETICLKCLRKDPRQRYASAADLADDLRRFQAHEPIRARRTGLVERAARWCRRNPTVAAMTAAVAVLLLVLAGGAVFLLHEEAERARSAERDTRDKLWRSHWNQARAIRVGQQIGHRFDSLAALAEAARLATSLDVPEEQLLELRNEALACLALTDLRQRSSWTTPADLLGVADFDPRLERYAFSDAHGHLLVRRLADHQEIFRISAPWTNADRGGCRFSPDGRFLVGWGGAGDRNNQFILWDVNRGREVLRGASGSTGTPYTFSPDGRRLAVGLPSGILGLYDTDQGREVTQLGPGLQADQLAFHPDGRRLALTNWTTPAVQVWDIDRRDVVRELSPPTGTLGVCWSPDGRWLAAGGRSGDIYLWEVLRPRPPVVLQGPGADVDHLIFNRAGTLLAAAEEFKRTRLWDLASGRLLLAAPGRALCFSPDDRKLAFQDRGHLGWWELRGGTELRTWSRIARALEFSPDGALLAATGEDGVHLWEVAAAREVADLRLDQCETAAFHPAGKSLVTYGKVSGLRLWPVQALPDEAGDHRQIGPPRVLWTTVWSRWGLPADGPQHRCQRACWGGEGRWLTVVDYRHEQALRLDPERPAEQLVLGKLPNLCSVALSPDGRWAAAGTVNASRVQVWRLADAQVVWEAPGQSDVAFSPDGQWLVSGGPRDYRCWHAGSWEPTWVLPRDQSGRLESAPLAFAKDGRWLALARSPQTIQLVDPATGRERASLSTPESGAVLSLAFHPDGTRLAVARAGSPVQLWDLYALDAQLAALGLPGPPRVKVQEKPPMPRMDVTVIQPPPGDSGQQWRGYWRLRGQFHQQMGKTIEAIEDFTEALQILPVDAPPEERAELLRQRALAYCGIQAYDSALIDLRQARELAPNFAPACHDLARLYVTGPERLRDPDTALALARKAMALDPGQAAFANTLGIVCYRLGWYEQAAATLESHLRGRQGAAAVIGRLFLAMSYHQLRDPTKARAAYEQAQRWWQEHRPSTLPQVGEVQRFLGEAAAVLGEHPP
jgi:WD40 repeat protein/anti-sigma factor RsiW